MKRLFLFAVLSILIFSIVSCNKSQEDDNEIVYEQLPQDNDNIEFLSHVGKEFLQSFPVTDFNAIKEQTDFILEQYCHEENQTKDIKEYVRNCLNLIPGTDDGRVIDSGYITEIYNYTCRTYALNQFHAHTKWNGSKWIVEQEKTSDTRIECPGKDGVPVVFSLKNSGKEKDVYVYDIERSREDIYTGGTGFWLINIDEAYFRIPEHIQITLTHGEKELVSINVRTDLSSVSTNEYNFSRDALSLSFDIHVANFIIKCNRLKITNGGNNGTLVQFSIEREGKMLLSIDVAGSALWNDFTWNHDNINNLDKTIMASGIINKGLVNILNKIQLQVLCSDVRAYIDAIENARKNFKDESKAKGYIQMANSLAQISFYYNNQSTVQGYIEWEVLGIERSINSMYYDAQPVIVFADKSRYSLTNQTFFNENNFSDVIELYKNMLHDYKQLLGLND